MAESGDPHVQTLTSPSGKTLRVLERGEGINYTAGEGNPIEIMDMSFLSVLTRHSSSLKSQ